MNPIGAYTAISVVVMAMIGSPSSRAPSIAAWKRDLPISMCRCTFSTTTIASSTTTPIASTMASRVSRLIEKPASSIRKAAPTSDRGTATAGTIAARSEPSDRKMTTSTISTASTRVVNTSSIESWMKALAS